MTLKDKIVFGYLTSYEFSKLIDANVYNAAILNLRIWWQIDNKAITGRISDNGTLIFKKVYKGEHTHVLLSKMHFDWSLIFFKRIALKNEEEHKQKMIEQEALGGQNQEYVDRYEDRPTLGEREKFR